MIGKETQSQVLHLLKVGETNRKKRQIVGNKNLRCFRGERKGNWARVWALAVISEARGKGASLYYLSIQDREISPRTKIRQILFLLFGFIDPGFPVSIALAVCTSTSGRLGGVAEQIGFMEALGLRFVRVMDQTYNYAFPMSINVISENGAVLG